MAAVQPVPAATFFDALHMVVLPALAVMTAVPACNLLGDACGDWLDPRTRSKMAAMEQSR
jgi:ABC-type dipeptide/oligopeptide/nickel transport system permease subunit